MVKSKPFFLLLFLVLLLSLMCFPVSSKPPTYDTSTGNTYYSASSSLDHLYSGVWVLPRSDFLGHPLTWPDFCEIELVNPSGKIVWRGQYNAEIVSRDSETFKVNLEKKDLKVPAFADVGTWKIKVRWYPESWLSIGDWKIQSEFTVTESSAIDNYFAPIAFYWDVFGFMASGDEISFMFPSAFYLSLVVLIPASIIITLLLTKTGYKIGIKLLKREVNEKNVKK